MRILGRVVPLKYAVGAAAVLLAISGSVAVVATTSFDAKPPPHVAVPGVSAERLAEGGISLSPASAAEASVTPDSAVRAGSVLGLRHALCPDRKGLPLSVPTQSDRS